MAAFVAVVACHGEAAEARRAEAGRIAEAVRALRAAPNDAKRPLLRLLHDAPCSAADLCGLRKSCEDAYGLELSALDGISAVRRAVRTADAVPPEAAQLLTRSEGDLRRAAELTKACADNEGEARRRYSL